MNATDLASAIADDATRFAWADAAGRVTELERDLTRAPRTLPTAQGSKLIQALLNTRWFDLAARVGALLRADGNKANALARRHAQALIELGRLAEARDLLAEQLVGPADGEFAELHGLMGRVDKQAFIEGMRRSGAHDPSLLRRAIQSYDSGYRLHPEENTWHGINMVACLCYAKRHGLNSALTHDPEPLAADVMANLAAKNALDQWDIGTRAEALIAQGKMGEAALALREYAEHSQITAFNLASTLRQFEEIWELDSAVDPARGLPFILRARLSQMENGAVTMLPDHVRRVADGSATRELEAVFGPARFTSLDWLRIAVQRCGSVAKIGSETVTGGGTGFLMRGSDIRPAWGDGLVLLTNAHVVSTNPNAAFAPADARVRFQASESIPATDVYRIEEVLYSSPEKELDVTIARIDPPLRAGQGLASTRNVPVAGGAGRVLLIGHPSGGDISFSIMDNALLAHNERYLHYRTPTEGGMSGSPVFNMNWQVIGIHHAGGNSLQRLDGQVGTYQANEGIRFDAIVRNANEILG